MERALRRLWKGGSGSRNRALGFYVGCDLGISWQMMGGMRYGFI